jgi:4-amino-4-deoxy-L-arabinose transferase-like glycosyltransferase
MQLAIAGTTILVIVLLRQWLQLTHLNAEITEAFYINDTSLFRYATTQLVVWMCGWSYLLVATIPAWSLPTLARQHWREWAIVTGIIAVAGVLRWVDLGIIPNIINGDEGLIGKWASQLMTQIGTLGLVFANMDGVGTNYLYVMAWIFQLFGQNALTVRLLPALFGVLAIATNYLFTRALFGQRTATIMAVLLTFAHVHVHFSRTVAVSYIYATALVPLVLWGIWQVVQTRQFWPAVIAALALAVHVNMYVDGWAWSVLVLLIIVAWLIVDRAPVVAAWRQLAVMLGLMILGLAPMMLWGIYHPGDFFARLSTDGSVVTGWVAREAASKGISSFQQILEMYRYALATFITIPFGDFYHADVPTLDIVSAVLFVIGLVLVHNRMHTRRMLLVLGWFWGGVTALAVFTIPLSTYHYRLLVVLPVVYVLVAVALEWGAGLLERLIPHIGAIGVNVLLGLVLVGISWQNHAIYRTELATVCRYGGDMQTKQAGALADHLYRMQLQGGIVYVYGDPNGFYFGPWRSLPFLNPQLEFYNSEDATDGVTEDAILPVYAVAVPQRRPELAALQTTSVTPQPIVAITQCGEDVLYIVRVMSP